MNLLIKQEKHNGRRTVYRQLESSYNEGNKIIHSWDDTQYGNNTVRVHL